MKRIKFVSQVPAKQEETLPEREVHAYQRLLYRCNTCGRYFMTETKPTSCPYCGSTDITQVGYERALAAYERRTLSPEEAGEMMAQVKMLMREHLRRMKDLFDRLFEEMISDWI